MNKYLEKIAEHAGGWDTTKTVVGHSLIGLPIGAAAGIGLGVAAKRLGGTSVGNKFLKKYVTKDPESMLEYAPALGALLGADHGAGLASEIGTARAAGKHIQKQAGFMDFVSAARTGVKSFMQTPKTFTGPAIRPATVGIRG